MSNQEILYCLYIEKGLPTKVVSLKDIERFVINEKSNLKSKGNNISTSALINYAMLKFILEYCVPPYEKISSSDKWELYHVEMVFFQLGSEKWNN
jgi:hypothetical protein